MVICKIQSRREFLKMIYFTFLGLSITNLSCKNVGKEICPDQIEINGRPNIILIMGDDIGFSDIGCYGSEIRTPNIDRLAENGIRFKQFYNMAKCAPTRSSLLTGLYKGNNRAISIPQILNRTGYTTIFCGKEHLDKWVPKDCRAANSFDNAFYHGGNEFFFPPSKKFKNPFFLNKKKLKPSKIECNEQPFYKPDIVTDYALKWMDEAIRSNEPFFLYLPYHVAHYPLQARQEDIARYRGKYKEGWDTIRKRRFKQMIELEIIPPNCKLSPPEDNINKYRGHPKGNEEIREKIPKYRPWDSLKEEEKDKMDLEMAVYAAMIDRMDYNIGKILKMLEENDLMKNTIIMFLTDNGSCPYDSNRDFEHPPGGPDSFRSLCAAWANVGNTPFRFYKQFGHEGGCNTHFIVFWPKVIRPGIISNQPGHVVDIFPTILEIINEKYPKEYNGIPTIPLHGISLLSIFKGGNRQIPEFFISGFTEKFRMFRRGEWKIVKTNNEDWELYNLKEDPTELNDLANSMNEKVIELSNMCEHVKNGFEK